VAKRCGIGPARRNRDLENHTAVLENPGHGSLHFKELEGHEALWSARVGRQYRALARRKGDLVVWVWIGHHSEYDRLIRGH
jgi:hypothetical protein